MFLLLLSQIFSVDVMKFLTGKCLQSTLLEWAGSSHHFPEPAAAAGQQGLGAVKASAQAGHDL